MIRDKGPLSSLGHGVTSRDVPLSDGEQQGPSPGDSPVAKALNGHPFLRFVSHNIASIVAAGTATALFRKRWLKGSPKDRKVCTQGYRTGTN